MPDKNDYERLFSLVFEAHQLSRVGEDSVHLFKAVDLILQAESMHLGYAGDYYTPAKMLCEIAEDMRRPARIRRFGADHDRYAAQEDARKLLRHMKEHIAGIIAA